MSKQETLRFRILSIDRGGQVIGTLAFDPTVSRVGIMLDESYRDEFAGAVRIILEGLIQRGKFNVKLAENLELERADETFLRAFRQVLFLHLRLIARREKTT